MIFICQKNNFHNSESGKFNRNYFSLNPNPCPNPIRFIFMKKKLYPYLTLTKAN